jgi:hypothetical protein
MYEDNAVHRLWVSWNRRRKVILCTFVTIIHQIIFTRLLWSRMLFEVKNFYVLRHKVLHLQPFCVTGGKEYNIEKYGFCMTSGSLFCLRRECNIFVQEASVVTSLQRRLRTFISCRGSFLYLFHLPLPTSLMRCLSGYSIVSSQTLPGQEQCNWMTSAVEMSVYQYSVVKVLLSNKCCLYYTWSFN